MPYCKKCGNELESDAEFCTECGTPIIKKSDERKEVYDGNVHKCPNCGEHLKSFKLKCPSCGHELRDSKSSNAVSEFVKKLEKANSEEQQYSDLIRSFPIPNNKEDILEFMILASSNIVGQSNKSVFDAWKSKFEHCYQKAVIMFENEKEFNQIDKIYKETNNKIKIQENKYTFLDTKKWLDKIMINPIFGIVVIGVSVYSLIRLFRGDFAGIDIIFDAIILTLVYKATNKNGGK